MELTGRGSPLLALHAEGVPRLATTVKLGTRTDKDPSLAGKLKG